MIVLRLKKKDLFSWIILANVVISFLDFKILTPMFLSYSLEFTTCCHCLVSSNVRFTFLISLFRLIGDCLMYNFWFHYYYFHIFLTLVFLSLFFKTLYQYCTQGIEKGSQIFMAAFLGHLVLPNIPERSFNPHPPIWRDKIHSLFC